MINLNDQHSDEGFKKWQRQQRMGRIVAGSLVITAGVVYLFHQMEYHVPEWFFTWPTLIIGFSILAAVKHGLNDWRWIVLFLVGTLFLAGYIYPESLILQYKIPIVLILIGLVLIFKPRKKKHQYDRYYNHMRMKTRRYGMGADCAPQVSETQEDYLYINNIFGAVEKSVISKGFKGGDIRNTFAGCEINLVQSDIQGEAVLLINQQFGGVKLIVPPQWVVKSDINCVFAGIEDKRPMVDINNQGEVKTLILRGTIFMAGIEIVSY